MYRLSEIESKATDEPTREALLSVLRARSLNSKTPAPTKITPPPPTPTPSVS